MNNTLSPAQIQALLEPFDYNVVEKRESDGQLLVPHEYVRARLSEIFGPLGWSEQTLELREIDLSRDFGKNFKEAGYAAVAYCAQVRVSVRYPDGSPGAFWDGAGAWGIERNDKSRIPIWEMHSDCRNGALSVAFLRATKNLGQQFGLPLYSQDRPIYSPRFYLTHPAPEPEQGTLDQPAEDHARENDPT